MGVEERGVHGHVGGGTGVRLHVDAPLGLVEAVSGERAVLAEDLDLVDVLVAAVVARAGETLGVLVGEARAQSLHHGRGGEVLGRDELDAAAVFGEMGEGREGERREKEARVGTDWRVLCRRAG